MRSVGPNHHSSLGIESHMHKYKAGACEWHSAKGRKQREGRKQRGGQQMVGCRAYMVHTRQWPVMQGTASLA